MTGHQMTGRAAFSKSISTVGRYSSEAHHCRPSGQGLKTLHCCLHIPQHPGQHLLTMMTKIALREEDTRAKLIFINHIHIERQATNKTSLSVTFQIHRGQGKTHIHGDRLADQRNDMQAILSAF